MNGEKVADLGEMKKFASSATYLIRVRRFGLN